MLPVAQILAFVIFAAGVWAIAWLVAASWETLTWSFSGERGALVFSGFGLRGMRVRRTAELQAILGHLGLITRLNLPLPSALRAAGRGETGRMGRTLSYMSYLVGAGWPLSDALGAAFRGCPVQLVEILHEGEQCGQLPRAVANVERMLATTVREHRGRVGDGRHAGTYAGLMLLFCALMLTGCMTIVMPKIRCIFVDFGATLPPFTLLLMEVYHWLAGYGALILLLFLAAVVALAAAGVWLRGRKRGGVLAWMISALRWVMPITRTLDYGLGMATAIRTMALGIRSGAPLDRAVMLTSAVGPTNHLRYRLAEFGREVQGGTTPHTAAGNAKLGDVFVSAVQMIERGQDAEPVLEHAADYYEAIARRWWHVVTAVSGPLVTLLIAGLVGFIALALFLPLVELIDTVSETIL